MAIIAYPFDSQDITEADYGALIGSAFASGIVGAPSANHFKVVTSASMTIAVTAVGGASLALVRGHACVLTANELLTIEAASPAARVDLIVLRMDYASNSIVPAVKKGTSGSATPPSLTWGTSGVYEIPLATIAVASGATSISSPNITDVRKYAGATIAAWVTDQRPSGQPAIGYNLTTATWEASLDGSTWVTLSVSTHTLDSHPGVLAVTKGGTGATTPNAAQLALNIYAQTAMPAHQAGRIWIKLP